MHIFAVFTFLLSFCLFVKAESREAAFDISSLFNEQYLTEIDDFLQEIGVPPSAFPEDFDVMVIEAVEDLKGTAGFKVDPMEIFQKAKKLIHYVAIMLFYCDENRKDYLHTLKEKLHDEKLAILINEIAPIFPVDMISKILRKLEASHIKEAVTLLNYQLENFHIFDTPLGNHLAPLVSGGKGFSTMNLPDHFRKVFVPLFIQYFNEMPVVFKRRIVASVLLSEVEDFEKDAMKIVANSFLGAGPILQKLVQLLGQFIQTPEWRPFFNKLRSEVPPMLPEDMKIFYNEIPDFLSEFEKFDKKAIASGTIGQVHKAKLKSGEHVAVKLLKSDALEFIEIENDFIEGLFKKNKFKQVLDELNKRQKDHYFYMSIYGDKEQEKKDLGMALHDYREMYEDFKTEFDFANEAKNTESGAKYYNNKKLGIVVPKVIKQLKNSKGATVAILTEWIDGKTVDSFLETADEEAKCWYARTIRQFFYEYAIRVGIYNGFYHADVHRGNMMVKKNNGKYELYLIDFGNAGIITVKQRFQIVRLFKTAMSGNVKKYVAKFKKIAKESSKLEVDDSKWELFEKDLSELMEKAKETHEKDYLAAKKRYNENKNMTAFQRFKDKKIHKYIFLPTAKSAKLVFGSTLLALQYGIPLPKAFVGLARGQTFLMIESADVMKFPNCGITNDNDNFLLHLKRKWFGITKKATKIHVFRLDR